MIIWKAIHCSSLLALWLGSSWTAAADGRAEQGTNLLAIRSVEVNGQPMRFQSGGEVNLGSNPRHVAFFFDTISNAIGTPLRIRCKLDGIDNAWREGGGYMYLTMRFYDAQGDRLTDKNFVVQKDSSGWNGTLETSTLTHRRESITVPPEASSLWLVISSAGPPSTTGIYVVDDIVISRLSTDGGKSQILLRSPFGQQSDEGSDKQPPSGWERDGNHPSMAKIVEIGQFPKTKAFAIVDDDRFSHAEWHNTRQLAPAV